LSSFLASKSISSSVPKNVTQRDLRDAGQKKCPSRVPQRPLRSGRYCSASLAHPLCIEALSRMPDTTFTFVFFVWRSCFGDMVRKWISSKRKFSPDSPKQLIRRFCRTLFGGCDWRYSNSPEGDPMLISVETGQVHERR
jgi:hypothetical protein